MPGTNMAGSDGVDTVFKSRAVLDSRFDHPGPDLAPPVRRQDASIVCRHGAFVGEAVDRRYAFRQRVEQGGPPTHWSER